MEFKTNDKITFELEGGLHINAKIIYKSMNADNVKIQIIDGDEDFKDTFGREMRANLKRVKTFQNIPIIKIRHALDVDELDETDSTDLKKEDYEAMIDLALDTNDKDWFDELTRKIAWFK